MSRNITLKAVNAMNKAIGFEGGCFMREVEGGGQMLGRGVEGGARCLGRGLREGQMLGRGVEGGGRC